MKTTDRRRKTIETAIDQRVLTGRLLDTLVRCLTPGVAKRIIELRADPETAARVQELAEKCNEGQLTPADRADYETYVSISTFVAILQAKARAHLSRNDKS